MIAEEAKSKVQQVVEELGYEIVEVTYKKVEGSDTLTFYIYKKGGINLEDCEKVNNIIDPILDEIDITKGAEYTLQVSSPGLDREIISNDDLRRNLDEEIEVFLNVFVGKISKAIGQLLEYNDETIKILSKDKEKIIERNNIKKMQPYIRF